jgi:hypothetical protein
MELSKSLRIKVVLVIAPFFSGCDSDLQLSRKSDVELCVEAHVQALYKIDWNTYFALELPANEKIAGYHLLCLRASAGK